MPVTLATWESLEQLRQQFPRAPAWGQAASKEGESVMQRKPPRSKPSLAQRGPEDKLGPANV
jgi:hypothetical protein